MNARYHDSGTPSPDIQIFTGKKGIIAVESPLKGRILEMLREGEMDFDEIVTHAGRAKSTISAHLKTLSEAGIITSRTHPADGRKKIISLSGRLIVGASSEEREQLLAEKFLPSSIPLDAGTNEVFRFILTSIRISLLSDGISIDPILTRAGERTGETIYSQVKDPDMDVMMRNIKSFWNRYGLGAVEMERKDPLTLVIRDCFECIDLPFTGKPECAFESGVLSTIYSRHYGEKQEAIETHCYAMGSNLCRFEILDAK